MNQAKRKFAAAGLALSLTLGQTALASEALGHDLHWGQRPLSEGTQLTTRLFWSDTYSDLRTERYVTYSPNAAVTPTVAYGEYLVKRETLSTMARRLESGGKRVVGGTNGDFYVLATGQPLGMVVTDGVLRSSSSYHSAIGFRADGTAFIGQPSLQITAVMPDGTLSITGGVNKVRQRFAADGSGGVTLLTSDFAPTTQNTEPGVDVFLRVATQEEIAEREAGGGSGQAQPAGGNDGHTQAGGENGGQAQTGEETGGQTQAGEESGEQAQTGGENDGQTQTGGENDGQTQAGEENGGQTQTGGENDGQTQTGGENDGQAQTEGTNGDETRSGRANETGMQAAQAKPAGRTARSGGQDDTASGALQIGKRLRCTVDFVTDAAGENPIYPGGFVLTMNSGDNPDILARLLALKPGDPVDITVSSADPRWSEAKEALGGMYRLLENGRLGQNLSAERTARTAIGIKADGSVIFYTLDGKQPGLSVGANCTQVAMRLLELGCVDALGLDGGGSTTLGVTWPDKQAMEVVNSPSDGRERSNSNAIFLTTRLQPTGQPGALWLTPGDALVLAGAKLDFSASLLDSAWYAMGPAQGTVYSAQGAGTVTPEGAFTAGSAAGEAVITGYAGQAGGSASVTVVDTPDAITVTDEATGGKVTALSLEPGEVVRLTASCTWRGLAPLSQDTCYTWQCDPAVGTVDAAGTFTAGTEGASGSLRVTAGGYTAEIPVAVASHIHILDDLEGESNGFTSTDTAQVQVETLRSSVRAGFRSLKLSYDTGETGLARADANLPIPAGDSHLGVWVYADGSGNRLSAVVRDPSSETGESVVPLTRLDFTGWKHILISLPAGTTALTGLEIAGEGGQTPAGELWLDQFTTANRALEDFEGPSITLKVQGNVLTATINDNVDQSVEAQAVSAMIDARAVTGSWDADKDVLRVELPVPASGLCRVSVTARDKSGNIGRASVELGSQGQGAFADLEGHWSAKYANYLYDQGIAQGELKGDVRVYLPDSQITRAEFFTMAARWLGLELTAYEAVELPFADAGAIPAWAVPAIKAMYAQGIVTGSLEGDGLYAHPGSTVTRAEVMSILGRTQERGYPEAELAGFSDQGEIPAWAAEYVRTLVGQGVINGFGDGTLRPSEPMSRGEAAKVLFTLR